MVCPPCKKQDHGNCAGKKGKTWCDCQHKPHQEGTSGRA
jgi:hypothetical protein